MAQALRASSPERQCLLRQLSPRALPQRRRSRRAARSGGNVRPTRSICYQFFYPSPAPEYSDLGKRVALEVSWAQLCLVRHSPTAKRAQQLARDGIFLRAESGGAQGL